MPLRLDYCAYAQKGFKRRFSGAACSVALNVSQSGDYGTLSAAPAFARGIWCHAWIRLRGAATNGQESAERRPFVWRALIGASHRGGNVRPEPDRSEAVGALETLA